MRRLIAAVEIHQHEIREALLEWLSKRTSVPVKKVDFSLTAGGLVTASVLFELPGSSDSGDPSVPIDPKELFG